MNYRLLPAATRRLRSAIALLIISVLALAPFVLIQGKASAAACTAPSTDYGTATTSVSLPAAATYRVWTRINVPDTTNNTYLLEIDGNKCYTVGGGSIATNSWVWVAHQNGNTASTIDVALAQGSRSIKLIGNKPNVKIDRLVFTSDLSCTPTGNGDNCNVPSDTSAPAVRITAPAADASVSGTVNMTATATDTVGVAKVEFYVNSSLLGSDTSSPYGVSWDTTKVPNGTQLLTAKAYDAAGNVGVDSFNVSVENGDKQAPSVPSGLSATATAYNAVTVSWKASTDNTGVKGYTIFRDGLPLADLGNVTTYKDSGLMANTTYSYKVLAFDANGNKSAASNAVSVKTPQPPFNDTEKPTKPTGLTATAASQTQIDLTWVASTDNVGVTKYDIYRATNATDKGEVIGSSQTPSFGDTNLAANTTYTYYVIAKDAAGNSSDASDRATATTNPVPKKKRTIRGVVRDQADNKRIGYASVTYTVDSTKHISQANSRGRYALQHLEPGRYNLTYRANKYYSKTLSVTLGDVTIVKDVTLQKRAQ
ncbi:MAG TPA: Ig-like domain-containing protein [Candidatus Saccharimonadales bacterium]|nr:Ig-like domain-containing protein [Candidatus Saccharimonadales bacterium]